jgi:glutaredoxin 3
MAKITIYSTATCGFCRMLKSYLQSKNIAYDEKHADQDPDLARELYEMSGQLGVPFTIIETDEGKKEAILGFDKPRFDQVLHLT